MSLRIQRMTEIYPIKMSDTISFYKSHQAILSGNYNRHQLHSRAIKLASILHKSIAGRYRPLRVADVPITARCRFRKNASWGEVGETGQYYVLIDNLNFKGSIFLKSRHFLSKKKKKKKKKKRFNKLIYVLIHS